MGRRFDVRIQEAIVLACEDIAAADAELTKIHEEASEDADRAAAVACLKALSVITSVTGAKDGRWLEICRTLSEVDSENPSSWITLGQAEEGHGRFAAAGRAYLKALELSMDKRTDALLKDALDRIARAMARSSVG